MANRWSIIARLPVGSLLPRQPGESESRINWAYDQIDYFVGEIRIKHLKHETQILGRPSKNRRGVSLRVGVGEVQDV